LNTLLLQAAVAVALVIFLPLVLMEAAVVLVVCKHQQLVLALL
jgi:hypothetical protein